MEELNPDREREIVTTREFDFPRSIVYRAWADPDHLKNWWGPNGFTNTFHTFEFREGGRWIFTMHGPGKGHYENACTFRVIREPALITWDRQSKPLFQVEVNLEELPGNKTRVIFRQKFKTAEECNKLRKFVPEKNEENMDRLRSWCLPFQRMRPENRDPNLSERSSDYFMYFTAGIKTD